MQTTSRWSKNSIKFIHIPTGECQDIYCCPFRVKTTFHQMHVSWNSWLTLSIFVALLYSPRTNLTYLDDTNLTALTTLLTTRQRVSIRPRCMQSLYWMIPIFVYFFRFFPPSPPSFFIRVGVDRSIRNKDQARICAIVDKSLSEIYPVPERYRTISDIKTDKAARFVIYFCNGNIQMYRYVR